MEAFRYFLHPLKGRRFHLIQENSQSFLKICILIRYGRTLAWTKLCVMFITAVCVSIINNFVLPFKVIPLARLDRQYFGRIE